MTTDGRLDTAEVALLTSLACSSEGAVLKQYLGIERLQHVNVCLKGSGDSILRAQGAVGALDAVSAQLERLRRQRMNDA
jgi:hypothetical protein